MTVITALITPRWTVHVTDSLITVLRPDGTREPVEWENPKIVGVHKFRGAISYWGLAEIRGQWSTLDWLRAQAREAERFMTPETFAEHLADQLEQELGRLRFRAPVDKGIGLHLTAYERVEDRWIPELFLISNWLNTSYDALRDTGVGASRETLKTLHGRTFSHAVDAWPELRGWVAEYLGRGGWFSFNNGDPFLYNIASKAILDMLGVSAQRGMLQRLGDVGTFIRWAATPVEVVRGVQRDFYRDGLRVVGGRVHNLAISPEGQYESTSGDSP